VVNAPASDVGKTNVRNAINHHINRTANTSASSCNMVNFYQYGHTTYHDIATFYDLSFAEPRLQITVKSLKAMWALTLQIHVLLAHKHFGAYFNTSLKLTGTPES
jgi:hypothetical protein